MEGSIRLSTIWRTIQEQIVRHPLAAFVFLAYMISWIPWHLMGLLDMGAVNGFSIIAGAGPALSATIVSAILRPEQSGVSKEKRWRLFGIIWIGYLSFLAFRRYWASTGLITLESAVASDVIYPSAWSLLFDTLAAATVAFFLSGIYSQWEGVRYLMRSFRLREQPVRWYWYVMAVGIYPAIVTIGNLISARLGLPTPAMRATGAWYWLAVDVILWYLAVLLGGGGLEEPGWRGFALPFLQKRYSPLRSSLILAVIWAFWHWPMFWLGYYGGGPLGVFFYVLGVIPIALLLTAVFNLTKGSIPVAMLHHASINTTPVFISASTIATGIWMLLILAVVLWMWRSPQTFLPVHQS